MSWIIKVVRLSSLQSKCKSSKILIHVTYMHIEECIMPPSKIDLNISVIYKTIKIKILISNHKKGQQKYPQNGQPKKKIHKWDNKNKIKDTKY